jgi:hypothetical protein
VNWWVNKARVTKLGLVYACWSFLIGEHMSIWMSPFCFESSCARDRCNMIPHIPPSRAHDDSKQKGDIHMDMCSPIKNDQQAYTRPRKNDHSLLLITVRYLKLKCDLYYINLNVIDKRHSIYIQIYLETLSIYTDEILRHNWSRKSMAR